MNRPLILHLETATEVCSVALSSGAVCLVEKTYPEPRAHAAMLAVLIRDVLEEAAVTFKDLSAVSVSRGPGSYTGLRIGVASAKGLCYALNIPLIAVDTLEGMSAVFRDQFSFVDEQELMLPMIDARRMEVYGAVYNRNLEVVLSVRAEVLEADSFETGKPLVLFGDGAAKAAELYAERPGIRYVPDFKPSAKGLIGRAYEKFVEGETEDIAYFEPFYLKEFVSTVRKT